jgi:hypothetical protein
MKRLAIVGMLLLLTVEVGHASMLDNLLARIGLLPVSPPKQTVCAAPAQAVPPRMQSRDVIIQKLNEANERAARLEKLLKAQERKD